MPDWLSKLDFLSLGIGTVAGALVSTWYSFFVKRPILRLTGSGGGGGPGPGFQEKYVRVSNVPGLLGIKLEPTSIFGKSIHRRIEKGLPYERETARECTAFIYQKGTDILIKQLWWRTDYKKYSRKIDINSGENADLMLLCRLFNDKLKFFVFDYDESENKTRVPDEELKLEPPMSLYVEVRYSRGRQKFRFDINIIKDFDGKLRYVTPTSGGLF